MLIKNNMVVQGFAEMSDAPLPDDIESGFLL